ncbi:MAG: SRPBCC domain-containing protein [Candidatus Eisenbacteria bacterium]|uniref:SRPBCC domain-containing protein n=1 Tax=Eiseniibacteriota bacterium TaxID=2212470 RepID=A0A7Y2E515_UNCEI|nr:SRPBCC domain-containing protein [Candidatus Eisenbacteria bacterium]
MASPTRKHVHEETFEVPPETLFKILHTPSAICAWWGAVSAIVSPETGGTWAASWGQTVDDPDFVTSATMREFNPPHRIVMDNYQYYAKSGPLPFDAAFVTEFAIIPKENGTSLRVTQDGFPGGPEGDAFLSGCEQGWKDTFAGIRQFLEQLPSQP